MWREVTEDDLIAVMAQAEINAFRQSAANDPVEPQIRSTVAFVRGIIRSACGSKVMCPNEKTLPESLILPAMDYLRFNMLMRFKMAANESRTKAYEHAIELWREIRNGSYTPEPYGEENQAAGEMALSPMAAPANPERLLD